MSLSQSRVAENLQQVHERIESACARSGRSVDSVNLVAVTKYAELEWVRDLLSLGIEDLGESRPQQLVERAGLIQQPLRWHMIGHLQRNKARKVLPLVSLIHAVDTLKLLTTLDRLAEELQLQPRVLLEVNVSGETAKHGFAPDELASGWPSVLACNYVQVEGLMTMAPLSADVETARPVFRGLRELRDRLVESSPANMRLPELSMGMSNDFEIGIEEGATQIRIGSSLFTGLSPEG